MIEADTKKIRKQFIQAARMLLQYRRCWIKLGGCFSDFEAGFREMCATTSNLHRIAKERERLMSVEWPAMMERNQSKLANAGMLANHQPVQGKTLEKGPFHASR
jgi:hypothetical protein